MRGPPLTSRNKPMKITDVKTNPTTRANQL